jgi:hypothetical protein
VREGGSVLEADRVIDLVVVGDGGVVLLLVFGEGSGLLVAAEEVLVEDAVLPLLRMHALLLAGPLYWLLGVVFLVRHLLVLVEGLLCLLFELPGPGLHGGQVLCGFGLISIVEVVEEGECISNIFIGDVVIVGRP